MSRLATPRRLLLATGVTLVLVGGVGALAPGTLVVPDTVALVALVVGVVVAVSLAVAFGVQDVRSPAIGRVERPTVRRPRVPGRVADELLAGVTATGRVRGEDAREAVYDRLTAVAVDTLVARYDCTPETARLRLREGSWTDDEVAAALFVEGVDPEWTVRDRLRTLWTGEPPVRRRARHALSELADLAEGRR